MTNRNNSNTNSTLNTVRFSLTYVPEHHQDLGIGTKRSAWDSDEHSHSSKHRDRLALPPKRPSRERKFLNDLPKEFFVNSPELSQDRQNNETQKGKQLVRKSILKNSKYNSSNTTQTVTHSTIPIDPDDSVAKSSSLMRNHRDSVLDLHRLACEKKERYQRQPSIGDESITIPSVLDIDDMDGDIDDLSTSSLNGSSRSFGTLDLVLEI
mmetsp:Transcript_23545/g.65356  ORF Transcript_23545/g.65356 Transcript_23545/m.65356 type:complete len:209 (-) Transcript_23545:173-799(-)|eukprot:CAMPEP_0172372634 /NCGR_PEP_ID=MMETSP1060-20121228/48588_1 /TAXON_ID=37318 /ORGANISM="Pseudo-nitzschia pungens, Strain cf. cingulata" /LENGTH=208 /DNA_ID=CAMNT_0013098719 /DNA_START=48 /DNA_END=674 /DNA_ORIENTATION=+